MDDKMHRLGGTAADHLGKKAVGNIICCRPSPSVTLSVVIGTGAMSRRGRGREGDDRRQTHSSLRFQDGGSRAGGARDGHPALSQKITELLDSKPEYSSPSFQPLTRAIQILSSINAEQELERLRSDWREVDALVNRAVDLHHVEFNRSLQEYSRLVALLKEVQVHMNGMRRNLGTAVEGISVDSEALLRATREYAESAEAVKLIEQVCSVRDGLERVRQMSVALKTTDDDDDALDGADGSRSTGSMNTSNNMNTTRGIRADEAVRLLLRLGNALAREEVRGIPAMKGATKSLQEEAGLILEYIIRDSEKRVFASARTRQASVYGQDGHVLSANIESTSLASPIAQLGGVDVSLERIRTRARLELRGSMVELLGRSADGASGPVVGRGRGGDGVALSSERRTLETVIGSLLKLSEEFLKGVGAYIRRLLRQRISAPSSGLLLIRGARREEDRCCNASAKRECSILWDGIQRELLRVLAAAMGLRAPPEGGLGGGGCDEQFLESIKRTHSVDRQGGLVFSVDDQIGSSGPSHGHEAGDPHKRDVRGPKCTGIDLERAVHSAIGKGSCTVYSAPAIYTQIKSFVSSCRKYLDEVDVDLDGDAADRSEVQTSPSIFDRIQANLGKISLSKSSIHGRNEELSTKTRDIERDFLLTYLVDILQTDFVPRVCLECGHRTQEIIASLVTSARMHTVSAHSVVENTVQLIHDLLEWSFQASVVAYDIVGVLENSLGKISDSLRSHACSIEGSKICVEMATDPRVSHLMAQEPIALLLGGPDWFACRDTPAIDSFLSSAIASGFAVGQNILPCELLECFTSIVPLDDARLILQSNNPKGIKSAVSLAVLGSTAERISSSIHDNIAALSKKVKNLGMDDANPKFVGLIDVAARYRAVSGLCTRILRTETLLVALYAIQNLLLRESSDSIAVMATQLASMDELLAKHLPQRLREYIFSSLPRFCGEVAILLHRVLDVEVTKDLADALARDLSGIQQVIGALGVDRVANVQDGVPPGSIERAILHFNLAAKTPENI
jgi:hypothetical protein